MDSQSMMYLSSCFRHTYNNLTSLVARDKTACQGQDSGEAIKRTKPLCHNNK